ncbi:hypothetical protein M404DRAFT_35006 [Pisolithus tinctorius Marx 270]|uniref:Uncharacterized protein n=1 Tax=Pisolithus tinctorius Marx 270 TaxID=870435 RepID=A0A0C3NGA6_PISTI|nr:hypothetical protein M404DRAFT_35006 [Pisolithus tinctorius Marx 270]
MSFLPHQAPHLQGSGALQSYQHEGSEEYVFPPIGPLGGLPKYFLEVPKTIKNPRSQVHDSLSRFGSIHSGPVPDGPIFTNVPLSDGSTSTDPNRPPLIQASHSGESFTEGVVEHPIKSLRHESGRIDLLAVAIPDPTIRILQSRRD